MKSLFRTLLLCSLCAAGHQAMALTASANFNATVTLTSVCRVKTGSDNLTLAFGTYTAFQATPKDAAAIDIEFECTRGFGAAPTVAFDTGADKTSSATGANATGAGVVAGLQYTLAVAAPTTTTGTAATTSSIGSATTYKFNVTGAIPAGQAGTSSPTAQTQVRLLTITY